LKRAIHSSKLPKQDAYRTTAAVTAFTLNSHRFDRRAQMRSNIHSTPQSTSSIQIAAATRQRVSEYAQTYSHKRQAAEVSRSAFCTSHT